MKPTLDERIGKINLKIDRVERQWAGFIIALGVACLFLFLLQLHLYSSIKSEIPEISAATISQLGLQNATIVWERECVREGKVYFQELEEWNMDYDICYPKSQLFLEKCKEYGGVYSDCVNYELSFRGECIDTIKLAKYYPNMYYLIRGSEYGWGWCDSLCERAWSRGCYSLNKSICESLNNLCELNCVIIFEENTKTVCTRYLETATLVREVMG